MSPYVRGGLAVPGINIWAISEWWRWRWRRRMMGDVYVYNALLVKRVTG